MAASQTGTSGDRLPEREKRWRDYLQDIRQGNSQALSRLYDEASSALYGLALRILGNAEDADEVLLDVFEQVWRKAGSFDAARGSVWRWLTLLTRSRALDRLRADASRREREQPGIEGEWELTSGAPLPDESSIFSQQRALIRRALSSLPHEQRRAIELAAFSELTHVEIAATLGVPLGTIKTRIRMGMEKLRNAFLEMQLGMGEPAQ